MSDDAFAVEAAEEPVGPRARNVRVVIRYQGAATIRQGKTVIEGACVVELEDDQLAEPALPWSRRFHDPAPGAKSKKDASRRWLNRLRWNRQPARTALIPTAAQDQLPRLLRLRRRALPGSGFTKSRRDRGLTDRRLSRVGGNATCQVGGSSAPAGRSASG
jgi:hypothetical protein